VHTATSEYYTALSYPFSRLLFINLSILVREGASGDPKLRDLANLVNKLQKISLLFFNPPPPPPSKILIAPMRRLPGHRLSIH